MTTDDKSVSDLLPCPFCGGAVEWCMGEHGDGSPWQYLACADCEAMGPASTNSDDQPAKIAAWNRRSHPSGYRLVPVEPTLEMLDAAGFSYPAKSANESVRRALTIGTYRAMVEAAPTPQSTEGK